MKFLVSAIYWLILGHMVRRQVHVYSRLKKSLCGVTEKPADINTHIPHDCALSFEHCSMDESLLEYVGFIDAWNFYDVEETELLVVGGGFTDG